MFCWGTIASLRLRCFKDNWWMKIQIWNEELTARGMEVAKCQWNTACILEEKQMYCRNLLNDTFFRNSLKADLLNWKNGTLWKIHLGLPKLPSGPLGCSLLRTFQWPVICPTQQLQALSCTPSPWIPLAEHDNGLYHWSSKMVLHFLGLRCSLAAK